MSKFASVDASREGSVSTSIRTKTIINAEVRKHGLTEQPSHSILTRQPSNSPDFRDLEPSQVHLTSQPIIKVENQHSSKKEVEPEAADKLNAPSSYVNESTLPDINKKAFNDSFVRTGATSPAGQQSSSLDGWEHTVGSTGQSHQRVRTYNKASKHTFLSPTQFLENGHVPPPRELRVDRQQPMSLSQLLPSGISTERMLSQISTKTAQHVTRNDIGPELHRSFDQRFNTLVAKDLKEYQVLKRNASKMSTKVKKFINKAAKTELNRIDQIAE